MSLKSDRSKKVENENDLYRQLFLNAAEGLILSDHKGIILESNPRAGTMFGYTQEELMGLSVDALIPLNRIGAHENHRKGYMKNPVNRSMGSGMVLTGLKKDGSEIPIEISLNSYRDGENVKVMALITDITQRREIEERIKQLNEDLEKRVEQRTREMMQSQNLYFTIARNFPDGTISVFDKELNYLFFEGKELYQSGIDSRRIIGTSIKDRLPADVKETVLEHLASVFKGVSGIMEFETKGNHYELNAVPLVDNNDKINQILVVERNTTVQKRAETEMVNALNQERALNELKSRFVSMASHEFRTPLSTILSSISLVDRYNEGVNEEKISKHIGRIKGSVQNLNGILNDFLSLDRLEEGNVKTSPVDFDINELVADLIDEMEATLKKDQRVMVTFDCDTDVIHEDAKIVKNILINLTSNAIKYSREGQDITLVVELKENILTLTVSDKGIGIPLDEQHHLFSRFFRARNVTNIEGTGLGLNIVGKYVALLNGKIEFDSKPGKGTTFIVTLPLKDKT